MKDNTRKELLPFLVDKIDKKLDELAEIEGISVTRLLDKKEQREKYGIPFTRQYLHYMKQEVNNPEKSSILLVPKSIISAMQFAGVKVSCHVQGLGTLDVYSL